MPAHDFYVGQGDAGGGIEAQLLDDEGTPVSLVGAAVRFHMAPTPGEPPTIDEEATIVTAATGIVAYTWQPADTAVAGLFYAQWEVTFSGGAVQTFPNGRYATVRVLEQIA